MLNTAEGMEQLGVVLGTEAAAPLEFHFAVAHGRKVQLDEIVAVTVMDPSDAERQIEFFGVVDAVTRRLEGVQFDGDTQLVAEGLLPAHVSYVARVRTTRVEPEEFVPPAPGDPVFLARGDTLARALFVDQMKRPLPAGVLRNGEKALINLDFIDGTKGAHINISGISGVATKTSYALFLLYSLFNARDDRNELLLGDAANSRAVIFNVKGRDLFYLDKPNGMFQEREQEWLLRSGFDVDRYERLGLPSSPFSNLEIRSPALAGSKGGDLLAEEQDDPRILPYCWSLFEFAADGLLPFMLSGHSDTSGLGFLIDNVTSRLQAIARNQRGRGPHLLVEPWTRLEDEGERRRIGEDEDFDLPGHAAEELSGSRERLESLGELIEYIEFRLLYDNEGKGAESWTARQPRGTCEALVRRLRGASRHVGRLVRGDLSAEKLARARPSILDSGSQIHVIDIHSLPQVAQMFTVGVLLRNVFERRETGTESGKVFIVLDELNKYAPAEGESPIKEVMLDIAERGRSLGVILIGAQQTASEVERRVVSNAAVRINGRLDAAEAERSEYRYLPVSMRQRATILTPGTMIINQPDVPAPVLVTFPFPAWATRREEALMLPDPDELDDILG